LQINADGKEWLTPCAPSDGGRPMTWKQVPTAKLREPDLTAADFFAVVTKVKPSVSAREIVRCQEWTQQFGSEGA